MIPTSLVGQKRTVLIVDQSDESREVLRTALQRRGVRIIEAVGASQGLELAEQHHPAVIVLDLEAEFTDPHEVCDQFDAQSRQQSSSLVVLGTARRYGQSLPQDQIVQKPYHYAPLVRKIEQLLAQ